MCVKSICILKYTHSCRKYATSLEVKIYTAKIFISKQVNKGMMMCRGIPTLVAQVAQATPIISEFTTVI